MWYLQLTDEFVSRYHDRPVGPFKYLSDIFEMLHRDYDTIERMGTSLRGQLYKLSNTNSYGHVYVEVYQE